VSTTAVPNRFTTLHREDAPQATVTALEEHGFSVEVVDDLDAAREAVLARIAEGSSVMTNTSVILQETWIRRRSTTAGATTRCVTDIRARFRDPGAGDEGDRRPAGLPPDSRERP
jgi:hypothetical protein